MNNKSQNHIIRKSILQIMVAVLLSSGVAVHAAPVYYSNDFPLLKTVKAYLKHDYVEKDLEDTELEYGAIRGMLDSLDDPYTRFMAPKNYKEMQVRMSGEFFGIGIHIGMRDKTLTVISPIVGTPAYRAGLQSLDSIMLIDGESTKGMSLAEAVNRIRGKRGTKVVLGIGRKGEAKVFDVPIVRGRIKLNSVDKVELLRNRVGYIKLITFESHNTTRDIEIAIRDLTAKKMAGLIVDLRYNGGGLLRNAIEIASIFLKEGEVVHTVGRDGKMKTERVSGRAIYTDQPVVILLNEGSASASEILAGAIQDNKRGLVVGRNSFGKASVQKVLKLPDGSAVLYTIAKYFTPAGTDITKKGIKVDFDVPVPTANIKVMQKPGYIYTFDSDIQLQKAIEVVLKEIGSKG
ncbi:MAG: carboxyl-terminal processing protease [Candidatus Marinamargulisbacteria bacterium]|jgi:carboxyl-terminal processing protease